MRDEAQTVAETWEAVINYIAAAAPRVPEIVVIEAANSALSQGEVLVTAFIGKWMQKRHAEAVEARQAESARPGLRQGLAQGGERGRRDTIIAALDAHFGPPAADLYAHIDAADDRAVLDRLPRLTVTVESLAAFEQAFDPRHAR